MDVDETVRTTVKRLREGLGWGQSTLAEHLKDAGWSAARQNTVSRIEKGEQSVKASELVTLAKVLGTDIEALTMGTADRRAAMHAWDEAEAAAVALRGASWKMTHKLGRLRKAVTPEVLETMDDDGRRQLEAVLEFGTPDADLIQQRVQLMRGPEEES